MISTIDGVASATVHTKQDALDEMKIKWKENQEVEVNELFPHTKNIILSSNTIPNYSKGETLYFSFENNYILYYINSENTMHYFIIFMTFCAFFFLL